MLNQRRWQRFCQPGPPRRPPAQLLCTEVRACWHLRRLGLLPFLTLGGGDERAFQMPFASSPFPVNSCQRAHPAVSPPSTQTGLCPKHAHLLAVPRACCPPLAFLPGDGGRHGGLPAMGVLTSYCCPCPGPRPVSVDQTGSCLWPFPCRMPPHAVLPPPACPWRTGGGGAWDLFCKRETQVPGVG